MIILDHIAVGCANLAEGRAYVEAQLGLKLQPGGKHPVFGTENLLMGLDDGIYLEVIAPDKTVPPPARPRWFGLDHWQGPPRLCNWVCRCDDLTAELKAAPQAGIESLALARGSLNWKFGVPADGSLSLGGLYPSLLEWGPGVEPPGQSLHSSGARLLSLKIEGPEAATAQHFLNQQLNDQRVSMRYDEKISFVARFDTPSGERVLR